MNYFKMVAILASQLPSNVYNKDWRKITVHRGEVVPGFVAVLEDTQSIKAYCGSSSPGHWTYKPNLLPQQPHFKIHSDHFIGNNHIVLNRLKTADNGIFYCLGEYEDHLGVQMFSDYIQVVVRERVRRAEVLPTSAEVSEGSNVTLTCGSSGQVHWVGVHLQDQIKIKEGNRLLLMNLRKEHSGPYMCRGIGTHGFIFHARTIIVVDGYLVESPFRNPEPAINSFFPLHEFYK